MKDSLRMEQWDIRILLEQEEKEKCYYEPN